MSEHQHHVIDTHEPINGLDVMLDGLYADAILQLLYDMDEGELPVENFFIAEIKSDHNQGNPEYAISRIDELLKELGINSVKWGGNFIEGSTTNGFGEYPILRAEAIHETRTGNGLGSFVTRTAFEALPIEQNEDGWGNTSILLARGDNHTVRLHTEGSLDLEDHSLFDSEEDAEDAGGEVYYTIKILADICLRHS